MLYVSDSTLYSFRSGILSQWNVLRTGRMWQCLGFFSNSTGESVLNSLDAVYLGDVYAQGRENCSTEMAAVKTKQFTLDIGLF